MMENIFPEKKTLGDSSVENPMHVDVQVTKRDKVSTNMSRSMVYGRTPKANRISQYSESKIMNLSTLPKIGAIRSKKL
jgi:hypothetical protein